VRAGGAASIRAISGQALPAVGLGIVLGAASWFADQLDWPLQLLVPTNAVGAWLAVAFAAGATGRTVVLGALRGFVALLGAVAAYYLLIRLLGEGIRPIGAPHAATVWGFVAAIAGPTLGAAGATWRHGRGWPRAISVSLLAAVLVAEGIVFGSARLPVNDPAGDPGTILLAVEALVGVVLPAMLLDRGERLRGYVALVALTAGAVLAIGPAVGLVRALADRF
jgi:hypothetical protein